MIVEVDSRYTTVVQKEYEVEVEVEATGYVQVYERNPGFASYL